MADKRLDSMNEYEQLKRKNRRRLVGASAMVLVAGIVFGVAVNGGDEGGNAAQNISINKDGGQPEILTPKPIEPAGGKTRQDELEIRCLPAAVRLRMKPPTTPSRCRLKRPRKCRPYMN